MRSTAYGMPCRVLKFVAHSKRVLNLAVDRGWLPGARYTNLRDVRDFSHLGFLDIDWQHYSFEAHLKATKATKPHMTVARDVESVGDLDETIRQAYALASYADHVAIVPKDPAMAGLMHRIPKSFLLGYSVPTKYGGTTISPSAFKHRVHLLGGRPDEQRRLAELMPVVSVDCNRFTLDAGFGDYFDGETFRPHPVGGYENCIVDSISNINNLWESYEVRGGEP